MRVHAAGAVIAVLAVGCGAGSLWPGDRTSLLATRGVGYGEPSCTLSDGGVFGGARYQLPFDGGPLDYRRCTPATGLVTEGTRQLSAAELTALEDTLRALKLTTSGCGADKGVQHLTITTPAGVLEYEDGFYFCGKTTGPTVYVDHIDEVFAKLAALSP